MDRIFNSPEFSNVRKIMENDVTLYCASDIAKALGYAKPHDAIKAHCRETQKRKTQTNGGIQTMSFIPESDVYRLIGHGKTPTAKKFEDIVEKAIKTAHPFRDELVKQGLFFFGNKDFIHQRVFRRDGVLWFGFDDLCENLHVLKEDTYYTVGKETIDGIEVVSEDNMYELFMYATDPSLLKSFMRWLAHDILPTFVDNEVGHLREECHRLTEEWEISSGTVEQLSIDLDFANDKLEKIRQIAKVVF